MRNVYRMNDIDRNLTIARFRPLDVLVIGATGAGKSSTLNALFQQEVAKVGGQCDPETMHVSSMNLNEMLRFWDTPGLGDGISEDRCHAEELIRLLYKDYYLDENRYGLVDLVLVILDGSGRDMGTTYKLLNEVVVPNFQTDRVLIAINQADVAMKGRHWDEEKNCPDEVLWEFLENKVDSIQARVKEATGIQVTRPVYYSAEKEFHVNELLDMIIDHMPKERRKLVL